MMGSEGYRRRAEERFEAMRRLVRERLADYLPGLQTGRHGWHYAREADPGSWSTFGQHRSS